MTGLCLLLVMCIYQTQREFLEQIQADPRSGCRHVFSRPRRHSLQAKASLCKLFTRLATTQTLHPLTSCWGIASKGSQAPWCARSQTTTVQAHTTKAQLKRSFLPVANEVKSFTIPNLVVFTFITSLEAYALGRVAE